ncbi:MAG TPA: gamma-glutamyltransferase family protein [Bryobacteraceae bacterium]|nr:gamma-glutamyltransferase family protein [Bryobacteraceae bacterium]
MKHTLALPLVLFICACSASAQRKDFELPTMHAARGTRGALASGSEYADEAGMRMYFHGGNAVDAGVASMFAASVAEFSHFGMGGEAPILIRTKDGKVHAIAGVGPMPKLATAKFFMEHRPRPGEILTLDPGGLKGIIPVAGILPALVPSMVEAGLVALRDFGTKSFSEEIEPAIELADGMAIDETRSGAISRSRAFFTLWADSRKTFLPDGRVPLPGEIFHQPNLARTLRSMAAAEKKALASGASRAAAIDAVADYFYRGDIAHRIDAFSQANGGLLRYEDMAAFKLQPEEPLSTDYHNYKVYKPGFYTQGPAMIQALNILEGYDLRSMGFNSAEYIHTITEALKLAYADRDTYYGDPKFNNIPADILLSKAYAAERRKEIVHTASMDFLPGAINGKRGKHPTEMDIARTKIDDALMASDTTCIDAIDKDGVVFSATPSGAWLPSVIAGDTGIPLTERAQQFILVPGSPNELAGGKRPRVTLSPTIITEQGKPFLALSTPGGDNQEQSLIQLFFNVIEFGDNAQAAVEAPRFQTRHLISSFDNHAWNRGDLLLDERIPQSVATELAARGHKVGTRSRWASGAAPVMIRVTPEGVIEAGADPYGYRVAHAY